MEYIQDINRRKALAIVLGIPAALLNIEKFERISERRTLQPDPIMLANLENGVRSRWQMYYSSLCSYILFPLPPHTPNIHPSVTEILDRFSSALIAFNFNDPRFDVCLLIGMVVGVIIGTWNGRNALRAFSKGKGVFDWMGL